MEQFKRSSSFHDSLRCMMFLGNLSCFTGTAETIFVEFYFVNTNDMFLGYESLKIFHPCMTKCKAPDVVLTITSRFRVRSKLEAHQKPPAHDTRTRVATGFSTTGKGTTTLTKTYI